MNKKTVADTGVLRAAGVMGIAVLLSRILGLAREQVFAVLFGAGNLTDAFNVAFRIPNLLRNLFAEGAMSASLVPTFTQARSQEGDLGAWRVAGLVFRVLTITVSLISLVGVIFAPGLVGLFAPAFHEIPGKFELTVRLTRILFPFFPLVALAAAFMGVLNACGVFFLPALSSALFNLVSIVVGVIASQILFHSGARWGIQPIEGMALGVLAGGAVQAFCQLPMLYRVGYRWSKPRMAEPSWHRNPHLKRMIWLMVPGIIGLGATQVSLLINTVLATSQGPGAVSWLSYAFRLMQFPIGIFGVSLATATLPVVSRQWVERDVAGVQATLKGSLGHVFAVNLPASAGLAFLGYPIVEMIFQYGRFYSEDTRATALALAMYAIGLTAYSVIKLLVPVFYAMGNARVPVISSVLAVLVTACLNLLMARPFGYWGLALGTSISALLNSAFLLFAIKKLLEDAGGRFPLRPVLGAFLKYLCVALAMGVAVYYTHGWLGLWLPDRILAAYCGKTGVVLSRLVKLTIVIFEGMALIVWLGKMAGMSESAEAVDKFTKKLKNKLRRQKT